MRKVIGACALDPAAQARRTELRHVQGARADEVHICVSLRGQKKAATHRVLHRIFLTLHKASSLATSIPSRPQPLLMEPLRSRSLH